MIKVYLRHFASVWRHKWFVLLAGLKLRVPLWRLVIHDWTKFTPAEFGRYARYSEVRRLRHEGNQSEAIFQGSLYQVEYQFALAWLNHESRNPHHWGYWIPRSGQWAGRPLPMPETYVREMVADWHGASRAYEGHWDISEWVAKQVPGYQFHPETAVLVRKVLAEAGYTRVVGDGWGYKCYFPLIGGAK